MTSQKLFFGPAGTPNSTQKKNTIDGIKRVKTLGLNCMEIEFVRGVKMGISTAQAVADTSTSQNIALSAHAPYYINLNSVDEEKIDASIERIYNAARIGAVCNAQSIVFHPAYYHKDLPEIVFDRVHNRLEKLVSRLQHENINTILRPETTGKPTQFGDLKETLILCSQLDNVLPCIDFAHLHARSNGKENSYEEFCIVLQQVETILGKEGLQNIHAHVSGIEYGSKGEKNHLLLKESDFNYTELMKALKDFKASGLIISESPDNEGDALLLQKIYHEL